MAACSQGHNGVTNYADWVTPGGTTTETNPYPVYRQRQRRHQHSLLTCLRIRGLAVRVRPSAPDKTANPLRLTLRNLRSNFGPTTRTGFSTLAKIHATLTLLANCRTLF